MSKFKGTKGKWKRVLLEETPLYPRRNKIQYGNDGESVAEYVNNDYDAKLISKAPEMFELLKKVRASIPLGAMLEELQQIEQLIKEITEI